MAIRGLQAWCDRLGKIEMPVLAAILKELNELTRSDKTEVNQLAEVILKDANLTSQVLRIANSVTYNPANYPINTVSRAIVLIGFSGVRAISISVMVIDSLLGKQPRERLLGLLAQAFHAAVQAKKLVRNLSEDVREEVFIAALLYHLGDMAFWSTGGKQADELEQRLQAGETPREAADAVLGTSLKAITRKLAQSWKLGSTLEQALYKPNDAPPRVEAVCLGEAISQAAVHGWDSAEVRQVLERMAAFLDTDLQSTRKQAQEAADEAAAVAVTYGAARVCHLIPTSDRESASEPPAGPRQLRPDPQLQLNVLRELTSAVAEQLDVNTLFSMVMEGLHRGIGLERVTLALIQGDMLEAKYVLGEGTETWREQFRFPLREQDEHLFSYAIAAREPLWLGTPQAPVAKSLYSNAIRGLLGERQAFTAPVQINGRAVGVFYADRGDTEATLNKEQFEAFRHFLNQTHLSLAAMAEAKRKRA